jgi:hypothetical protein
MYEASQTGDPDEKQAIYDFLGLSTDQRANTPETFATMDDINRLSQGYGRPLPDNTAERSAVNDRNAGVLDALRALGSKIKPTDSTQSAPSSLNLDTDVPLSLQQVIGRGLSTTDKVNLESNFFDAMIYTPRQTWINTPGMLDGFAKDFGEFTKGMSMSDVADYFREYAGKKHEEDPTINVNELLKFYGLGG